MTEKTSKNIFLRMLNTKAAASIFTLGPAYLLAIMGYQSIWTLFGAANQLLAALTLIACTLFLKKSGRRIFMLIIPTIIMLAVTYTSLIINIKNKYLLYVAGSFNINVDGIQLGITIMLLILGILIAVSCIKKLLEKDVAGMETAV
jgi:carbon starvation protein